ncbi:MAG: PD40 domain-containing protein [Chloracidobacterium sp.]|nr:PD40 domain-containing protein [Chloracidobacterium sp.]
MNNPLNRTLLRLLLLIITTIPPAFGPALAQSPSAPELRLERFHGGTVYRVAFSPNGKLLASTHNDGSISLWDARSGRFVLSFVGHTGFVTSIVFSPDGKLLAGGSTDSTVKLWEVSSGRFVHSFAGHKDSVYGVAFSPDGKSLASGSNDKMIKLWGISGGNLIRTFPGHNSFVRSVAFSPDGKWLASGSYDYTVGLWELSSGRRIRSFEGNNNWVESVTFSPDGKTIASGSSNSEIKLWETGSGNLINSFDGQLSSSPGPVTFSPDGKMIAYASYNSTIELWDPGSGHRIRSLKDHSESVTSLAFSPDGKSLASGSYDGTIKIWAPTTGNLLATLMRFKDGNWISFTPIGYHVSSEGAPRHIVWVDEQNFYNGDESRGADFTSRFNQPDKVAATLRGEKIEKVAVGEKIEKVAVGATSGGTGRNEADTAGVATAIKKPDKPPIAVEPPKQPAANHVTTTAPANAGRYHALLIAVQQYDHPNVNGLDYPVSDAQRIERELTSRYTFDPRNVTLLKNPDRRSILDALDLMTEKLKPEDNLLIFYAGHGYWDEDRKQGYWLPRDAMRERRADWISNSDLRDAIRGIKARHILLVSDACFAGGIFLAREAFGPASSAVAELDNLPSRTAMTSGALTTVPDRSVFVEYLIKGLGDNAEERLPALELFGKIRLPVINNSSPQRDGSRPTPRYGTIFEAGDEGGDFIFVRRH